MTDPIMVDKNSEKLKALWRSDVILGALVFLLIDLIFRISISSGKESTLGFDAPYRSRPFWTAKAFQERKETPDLLLLGASDMTCAFYGAEARYLNQPVLQLVEHESQYLQKKLKEYDTPYK